MNIRQRVKKLEAQGGPDREPPIVFWRIVEPTKDGPKPGPLKMAWLPGLNVGRVYRDAGETDEEFVSRVTSLSANNEVSA